MGLQEPHWNHAIEEQAIDRLHRLGQTKPVKVYHFIAEDTVEENICKVSAIHNISGCSHVT